MVDLTVTNVALGAQSSKRSTQWLSQLESTLNASCVHPRSEEDDRYECIGSRYLVGILIAVYVKKKHVPFIRDIQDAEAPVGVMGVMGNKGGVSLRFRLFDSTFCFVAAHLAAHRNAVAQRNADFASIMGKTTFRNDALVEAGARSASGDMGHVGILDHDFVVWFGDFNYRIVETLSTERCFELAGGGDADLEQLRSRDQLNLERAAARSFHGFNEGPLTFRPTYKFQPGTNVYEARPEKKLRAPAWCDRILWRTSPAVAAGHCTLLYYGAVEALVTSDHKPVHALFETAVRTVIPDKFKSVMGDIGRAVDAMENRALPVVNVSANVVAVPDVVYAVPTSRAVTLSNVGEVAATWRFVPKPEEKLLCKTWLHVAPAYGMIPPGHSATVTLTIHVDDAVARDIGVGRETAVTSLLPPATGGSGSATGGVLEDILILRLERGRDVYLSVSATVLPTCFGCSLAQLSRRPEPMRALAVTAAATGAANAAVGATVGGLQPVGVPDLNAGSKLVSLAVGSDDSDVQALGSSDRSVKGHTLMSVPKELWRLVDVIFNRGLDTRGIFLAPGDPVDVLELRECLDTGDAFPAALDPLAAAQVLLDLLSSLREPVIPCACFPGTDFKSMPMDVYAPWVLKQLSPLHYNTLVYLIRFIREVLVHAPLNGTSSDTLALVFSRVLMRKLHHEEAPMHWRDPAGSSDARGAAAAVGGGGEEDEDSAAAAAVAILSSHADKGTRWEPTREEQESMTRVMAYYISPSAQLA